MVSVLIAIFMSSLDQTTSPPPCLPSQKIATVSGVLLMQMAILAAVTLAATVFLKQVPLRKSNAMSKEVPGAGH